MDPQRLKTVSVEIDGVTIGGCAPIVVQSMTDTDTAEVGPTTRQCLALAEEGAELVRLAVNTPAAADGVPEIRNRLNDQGCSVPLVGDFHFNGHRLLADHPECARALAKYRVNPANVGPGRRRDADFAAICGIARDLGKAIRIGVNGGSLDRTHIAAAMESNAARGDWLTAGEVIDNCMVDSALRSLSVANEAGLESDRIVLSCKVSSPPDLIRVYRRLSRETEQPLHLGLTEAGMGIRGLVWSAAAAAPLLAEGIGDTIRVSLTPPPDGDRCEEVVAARELLQALGLRQYAPSITACPGCGRTTGTVFRELAQRVDSHLRGRLPEWRERCPGVDDLKIAVMGCIVNGPGESRTADIGISLPGTGEAPRCPVYLDGEHTATIGGDVDELTVSFLAMIDEYVKRKY